MKKNVLALSITAAVVGLGFAGGAQAIVTIGNGIAGANTTLAVNPGGVGQILLVPYYTVQGDNVTLLNLVNTDSANGKAVKVRFRGASNSDDVFDFQVFLSPNDVWTANISRLADGRATLTTSDVSCTKPAKAILNAKGFQLDRLDSALTTAQKAAQTTEGYVEIFNMADIPALAISPSTGANGLYTAIKHVAGVAPCGSGTTAAAWAALDTNRADYVAANAIGLASPTTGLMANWTILSQAGASAWTGSATAIHNVNSVGITMTPAAPLVLAPGNIVYWPQADDLVSYGTAGNYTADPLLSGATPIIKAAYYDLPDLSTPYTQTAGVVDAANVQAQQLSNSISTQSVSNEFLTTASISAKTDWVFSMPTRRYAVAYNYLAVGSAGIVRNSSNANYFDTTNTVIDIANPDTTKRRTICVDGIQYKPYDREETGVSSVVVSPASAPAFCGEVSVLSINNAGVIPSGALSASLTVKDVDVTFAEGWMRILTPGKGLGLPILGSSFVMAKSGASLFGGNADHRYAK